MGHDYYVTSGMKAADDKLWNSAQFEKHMAKFERRMSDPKYQRRANPRYAKLARDGRMYYQFSRGRPKFYYAKGNAVERGRAKTAMNDDQKKRQKKITRVRGNGDHDHDID